MEEEESVWAPRVSRVDWGLKPLLCPGSCMERSGRVLERMGGMVKQMLEKWYKYRGELLL